MAALAACAPAMVPAPVARPQPPYYGYGRVPPPLPPGPPSPASAGAAGPAKVALLVPLSGANAELGQAILDAAHASGYVFTKFTDPDPESKSHRVYLRHDIDNRIADAENVELRRGHVPTLV